MAQSSFKENRDLGISDASFILGASSELSSRMMGSLSYELMECSSAGFTSVVRVRQYTVI
jgi:hypothetical protein